MSHDPYSPCPCGSGQKLKFCCQDILPEMIRIEKLIENQPSAAEKILDDLLSKYDDKVFLVTHKAALLMSRQEVHAARDVLAGFLKRHPDEPLALLALADICLTVDGFANGKRIIHRAFQLVGKHFPSGVARLATRIAASMEAQQEVLSVREHLAMSVRMSDEQARGQVLMQLAYFESQRNVPYPLRGRFSLLPIELDDEALQKEELRARRVSRIGCWEPAAIIYSRLIKECPNHSGLWHNMALFQAWDGRSAEATAALKKSAELSDNYEERVETEALAQLLELERSDDTYSVHEVTLDVTSLTEAITVIEANKRFGEVKNRDQEEDEEDEKPVREYELLSQELADPVSADNVPDVLADASLFDSEEGGVIKLVGTSDELPAAVEFVKKTLGNLVTNTSEAFSFSKIPMAYRQFDWKIHNPSGLSNAVIKKLDKDRLDQRLNDWLAAPLASLNNTAPQDAIAAKVPTYQLDAAVLVLDAVCVRLGLHFDLADIRQRLNLQDLEPLQPAADQPLTGLPLLQFHRLDTSSITDDQAIEFANRISLIGHHRLLQTATAELTKRPAALEEFGPVRAFLLQATTAREALDSAQVAKSFNAARDSVEDSPDAFRTKLELNIRELSFRLDDPEDPELPALLKNIRDQYFHKIPEIADVIQEELSHSGCLHLMEHLTDSPKGLWTPDQVTADASSSSKLWMPGQSE